MTWKLRLFAIWAVTALLLASVCSAQSPNNCPDECIQARWYAQGTTLDLPTGINPADTMSIKWHAFEAYINGHWIAINGNPAWSGEYPFTAAGFRNFCDLDPTGHYRYKIELRIHDANTGAIKGRCGPLTVTDCDMSGPNPLFFHVNKMYNEYSDMGQE